MPPERDEVIKQFGQAAADLWAIARETPGLGAEQIAALKAVEDSKAIPRITIQLGHTLMIGIDVLNRYTEPAATSIVFIKMPPGSGEN